MKSLLIDTNFYAAIMLGNELAQEAFQRFDKILISPIMLGELFSGFKNGNREKENIYQFEKFLQLPSVDEVSLTKKTAEFYAVIYAQLKKAGTPLPTNDMWIAASAMEHGAALATHDQHFEKIHNLILVK